jgi:uroporphyrinogen-III synthase
VTVEGTAGADDLVALMGANGQRIVFPHARAADMSTATELEVGGATVIAAPAYDTIPIAPGDATVDAALFGSPSAVEGWTISRHLHGLVVGAMGATTATALRMRGVDDPVVPDRPGVDELTAALAERINS